MNTHDAVSSSFRSLHVGPGPYIYFVYFVYTTSEGWLKGKIKEDTHGLIDHHPDSIEYM